MGKINGWTRLHHHSNLREAEENLNEAGRVTIAAWTHEDDGRVEHIYEPDAERPFIVRQSDESLEFDEEGRYEHRYEGGRANKNLLEKYP